MRTPLLPNTLRTGILLVSSLIIGGALYWPFGAHAVSCALTPLSAYRTGALPGVYYITDGCTKRAIRNPDIFFSYFSSWRDVQITSASNLTRIPNDSLGFMPWGPLRTFQNGSLVKRVTDPRIYLLINQTAYPFDTGATFLAMGQEWRWVEDVAPAVLAKYQVGSPISATANYPAGFVFKYAGSTSVYRLHTDSGVQSKERIDSMAALQAIYRIDHIATLPTSVTFPDYVPPVSPIPAPPTQPSPTPTPTPTPAPTPTPTPAPAPSTGTSVTVSNISALRQALSTASAGATIVITPGVYSLDGVPLTFVRGGSASRPITVRAQTPNTAVINTNQAEEAFYLTQPYYVFDGLSIQVSGDGSYHAYKLNNDAHDVVIRNGKMEVYKGGESAIKGASPGIVGPYPDNLLVENNEIFFHEPTDHVVAEGIDAVGVKGWVIRGNSIHDIKILNTGSVAWGIVLKGNSQDAVIENNTFDNNDVAISIGGTTASQYFRNGETLYEHQRGIVRNNIIRHTRDVAIYLERAHETQIIGNTITESSMNGNSSSIDVRYRESTATVQNNTLDKPVRDRDGGTHVDLNSAPPPTPPTPPTPPPAPTPAPTPAPPVTSAGLSLTRDDNTGLPGMYAGAWATADFDGDGKIDVVMSGNLKRRYDSSDGLGGNDEVRVYRNVSTAGGAIRFELNQVIPNYSGIRGSMVVVGDFNADGRPDFAVELRNGNDIASFMNQGNWTFTKQTLQTGFANNSTSLGMVATDVDHDGADDLVFNSDGGVSAGLWYRWNKTTNRWESMQTNFSHRITYGGTIAAGDLNGDGYPEIAVGGNANLPFGSHACGDGATITSGGRLQYGETHLNLGGSTGFSNPAMAVVGAFGLKVPDATRQDINSCHGMDNAQMAIADLDQDGHNDVIMAGSVTGPNGVVGMNGSQYDFVTLFNRDGSGKNFEIWENTGPQDACGGTSNGGQGNVDYPSIAVGDLNGDGRPDVFVQGHHRDYLLKWTGTSCGKNSGPQDPYVFEDTVYVNNGNRTFTAVPLSSYLPTFGANETMPGVLNFLHGRPRYVAEGGEAIADFNNDGKPDLLFSGAELPFHSNGVNDTDYNSAATLKTYVLRNTK